MPFEQYREKFLRPEMFLSELITLAAEGQLQTSRSNPQVFFRAVVLAVDSVGGRLENPDGDGSVRLQVDGQQRTRRASVGPANPVGSFVGRLITDGIDRFLSDDDLRVFWPFFPTDHLTVPVKVEEHALVVFEGQSFERGLWVCRAPGHSGMNQSIGRTQYTDDEHSSVDLFVPPQSSAQILTDRSLSFRSDASADTITLFVD